MAFVGRGDPRGPQRLGDANLQERAIQLAQPADGKGVGNLDEVYAVVNLTVAGTLSVGHALGRVPTYARVHEVEAGPSGDLIVGVSSVEKSKWTTSTVRVRVAVLAGTITGGRLALAVG